MPQRLAGTRRFGHAAQVADMFGLHFRNSGGLRETLYDGLNFDVCAGQIVAVIGPSGAGKSVLLQCVERQARRLARGGVVRLATRELARCSLAAVEALPWGTLAEKLEVLSCCGLAEASPMVTPAKFLSGGQLHRLALARAILAARRRAMRRASGQGFPTLLIADEFAAVLDRTTAEMLCRQLRKLISGPAGDSLAVLLATPRAELLEVLQPDQVIVKPLGEAAFIRSAADCTPKPHPAELWSDPRDWPIERGTIHDYRTLAGFHYIAGPPAAHKRVYVIRPPGAAKRGEAVGWFEPAVAAVLVVSPPVMCVRGRNLATAGRYVAGAGSPRGGRRESLQLLNNEVECISRVIVHPAYRGSGLAVRLVRHAMADSASPLVESLAAMGGVHPLFTRSGFADFGTFEGAGPAAGKKYKQRPPQSRGRKYHYFLARTGAMLRPLQHREPLSLEESLRFLRATLAFFVLAGSLGPHKVARPPSGV